MIFSLKIKFKKKKKEKEKTQQHLERKLETISMKMTKSGIMHSTQVVRERKKVVGTLPTNHGHTSHDCNVSMHIIFMKNL